MMVPPRFNGCAADHIRKYRSEYINPVGIERIKIERVTNVPEVIASEVVKWSRTNPQSILILPVSPKELIAGKFLPHREEIKLISSFFRVSLDVARAQWLAIREQEALLIDARTAMIDEYACVFLEDPYDIEDPTIHDAVGYDAFCRRPESDIWVLVSQLPIHTQKLLSKRERIKGEWLLRETEKKS
jgi:hypothetical protein